MPTSILSWNGKVDTLTVKQLFPYLEKFAELHQRIFDKTIDLYFDDLCNRLDQQGSVFPNLFEKYDLDINVIPIYDENYNRFETNYYDVNFNRNTYQIEYKGADKNGLNKAREELKSIKNKLFRKFDDFAISERMLLDRRLLNPTIKEHFSELETIYGAKVTGFRIPFNHAYYTLTPDSSGRIYSLEPEFKYLDFVYVASCERPEYNNYLVDIFRSWEHILSYKPVKKFSDEQGIEFPLILTEPSVSLRYRHDVSLNALMLWIKTFFLNEMTVNFDFEKVNQVALSPQTINDRGFKEACFEEILQMFYDTSEHKLGTHLLKRYPHAGALLLEYYKGRNFYGSQNFTSNLLGNIKTDEE